jgi:hypothetical protein
MGNTAGRQTEERAVARKTGKLKTTKATTTNKQTPNKRKQIKTATSRFAPDATVTWAGRDNPFHEGCGAWERTEIVRKASGQTVSAMQGKAGLRGTTLATLARMELIKVG